MLFPKAWGDESTKSILDQQGTYRVFGDVDVLLSTVFDQLWL